MTRQWVARGRGLYETADGQFRVMNPPRPDTSRPAWQLMEADGNGGWSWWNTYPTKTAAQAALDKYEESK